MAERDNSGSKSIIKLGKQGIVYENKEEFANSIFNKIYERAFKLTELSVESQMSKYDSSQPHEQRDNIITFIGRRGTGKTSSMLSFMNSLKEEGMELDGGQKIRFFGLDWIDASLLEQGEDIFEIILAKMLGEFLENEEDNPQSGMELRYEMRNLHQKFGAIYKKVLNLKKRNSGQAYGDETAISALRELARSNDLRVEFESLVKRYIEVQCMWKAGIAQYTRTFLVVAIDDVDMNVDSGFEILEKIQRYLKVDGLIVLLAINYEQMLICCEKHFSKVYNDHSGYAQEIKNHYVSQIAEEYMDKALPSYMRLYLPSLKKKDYERNIVTVDKDGNERTVKESVFFLAEEKLRVRYDSAGWKRHFLEPNSLRNLNSQYIFQRAMDDLDEEKTCFLEKLDLNYRKKMDDLLFRYTFENLKLRERKFFTELSEEDVRRRGELIVSKFHNELNKRINESEKNTLLYVKKTASGEIVHEFQREFELYGYSYGILMRCFYFLGRENVFEKKLVHAFLDMYTIILTRAFYHYRDGELKKSAKERPYYKLITDVMGGSVAGTWSLYLMPRLKVSNGHSEVNQYSGAVKGARLQGILFADTKALSNRFAGLEKMEAGDSLITGMAELMEELTPQIILLLFLTEFRSELLSDQKYGLKKSGNKGRRPATDPFDILEKPDVKLIFGDVQADFNVLNFVNNIFIFDEIMENFIREIYCMVKAEAAENIEENVKNKLLSNKDSFYSAMIKWAKKYGGMVVPVYSADIYYNMLKRVERERKKSPVHNMLDDQLFMYLQKLLQSIREHLAVNDHYYQKCGMSKNLYCEAFDKCPVIEHLMKTENNEVKKLYNSVVSKIIRADSENEKLTEFEALRMLMD